VVDWQSSEQAPDDGQIFPYGGERTRVGLTAQARLEGGRTGAEAGDKGDAQSGGERRGLQRRLDRKAQWHHGNPDADWNPATGGSEVREHLVRLDP
jgi:hypothetical protein